MQRSVVPSSIQSSENAVDDELNAGLTQPQTVRWQGLSLRLKATLLAVTMSTLSIFSVGSAAFLVVRQNSQTEIEQQEKSLASAVQLHLNQYMWERFADIQVMASLDLFTDARRRETATIAEKSKALEQFLKAYPIYNNITVFDLNGTPSGIAQAKDLSPSEEPYRERSYIKDALRTKGPVISQPLFSTSAKSFSVYAAAPIRDKETGEIIGTVCARIPITQLSDLIPALKPQAGSSYYILDATGKVFYRLEGQSVNQPKTNEANDTSNDTTYREKQIEEIFPALGAIVKAKQPGSIVAYNAAMRSEQFVTYIPPTKSQGLPDLNWGVTLSTNLSVALAAQRQHLLVLLLGIGSTAILVTVLAALVTNRAVRPILISARAVEQIGQGYLETRLAVKGDDELSTLGSNINQMAAQLQALLETSRQDGARLQEQNTVLSALSRNEALSQCSSAVAARSFTEAIAKTLGVERASMWLYNADRSTLTCLDRYEAAIQQHSKGETLYASNLPGYFQILQIDQFLAVEDVTSHAAVQELLSAKVMSAATTMFLSIPVGSAENTVGFIQCERVTSPGIWHADEKTFVSGVANLVAIVLEGEFLQSEVSHLLDVVSAVEDGDLTTLAHVSDRVTGLVADTFNRLIERLCYVLTQVLDVTHHISSKANQQKLLAGTVEANAEQQAHAVNQVLDLAEQVEQAAQGAAERASISNESLQAMASTVMLGQTSINALTQGIEVLQEGTDRITQRMKTLGEFVSLADQFVQNQSQISFVTQTLSLNASLVAAGASEQRDPKRFVVIAREFDSIADQINQLAQQTSEGLSSLKRRSTQIHTAVSTVDADVQRMGELVMQFTAGVEQSQQVFNHVQTITSEAMQAGAAVGHFSQEIVASTQTTARVIRGIAELANETVTLTQSASEQSAQIDLLSAQLLQNVQFFQLPVISKDADETLTVSGSAPN